MKRFLLNTVAVGLLATSIGVSAGPRYQIQFTGANFFYNPAEIYEEMGVIDQENIDNGYGDSLAGVIPTNAAIQANLNQPIVDEDREYIVIRDTALNNGKGTSGIDPLDPSDPLNKGDSSFGDINFADKLGSLQLFRIDEDGNPESEPVEEFDGNAYIDFRLVLEEKLSPPVEQNEEEQYSIIEPFSYLDLLTQDGETDWGLALDAFDEDGGLVTVNDGQVLIDLGTALAGELFRDPDGADTNNLPFDLLNEIDEDAEISFTLDFQIFSDPDVDEDGNWEQFAGSGTGSVFVTGQEIPEPATLGIFGLALTGMGIMQRRRKKAAKPI